MVHLSKLLGGSEIMEETLLISRERINELQQKLKNHPDAASICTACGNVFSDAYEACDCVRFP